MILRIGDKVESTRILTVLVANGGYVGGGMHVAPEASLSDNLLDADPCWTHFYSPYETWLEKEFNIKGSSLIDKQVVLVAANRVNCKKETGYFWEDLDDWSEDFYLQLRLDM